MPELMPNLLWNNIGVVYPQLVYNLWISDVEGVKRVKLALNSSCQIAENEGNNFPIHRLWGMNLQVRACFVDTVHKYSTDDPQLVHILHKVIHKLSTGERFSSVDRPTCRRVLSTVTSS